MPYRTVHNCREVKWGWSKETETKQFDQMNGPFVSNDIICQITSMKICLIDEKITAVNKQQMSIIPSIKNDEEK